MQIICGPAAFTPETIAFRLVYIACCRYGWRMDIQNMKQACRKAGFDTRKTAHAQGLDKEANAQLTAFLKKQDADLVIAAYMPIRTEIDPLSAMAEAAAHGVVSVPVIEAAGLPLRFSRWQPDCEMKQGPFGAMIPTLDDFVEPEILIVPLVAFDAQGGRLGYGGGYYDRTLEQLRNHRATLAIGFAFDAQEASELPLEPTDQPLDMIVTEKRVLTFSN